MKQLFDTQAEFIQPVLTVITLFNRYFFSIYITLSIRIKYSIYFIIKSD